MDGGIEILARALAEHGQSIKSYTEQINTRLREVEQKLDRKHVPFNSGGGGADEEVGELTRLIEASDATKMFLAGNSAKVSIQVPRKALQTKAIANTGQTIVQADRQPRIVMPATRRFTIRDLLTSVPTTSNMVEVTKELVFSNAAAPQGGTASPTAESEGQPKAMSEITFQLAQVPVVTLAHYIVASRQVLSDSAQLEQYVSSRLTYGLKLEEERELLNGTGLAGELSGLITNSTAFAGGSTNLSSLDAVALAIAQLAAAEFIPSGVILNPQDYLSSKFLLAKDTQGRYIFGDPGASTEPRLWGIPTVVTNSMPVGKFLVMDGERAAYIADREDAVIRISENVNDQFIRNLITVLIEERLALVMQLSAAIVYGSLNYAG